MEKPFSLPSENVPSRPISLNSQLRERLVSLLSLIDLVDNPQATLPSSMTDIELLELILDLGLFCKELGFSKTLNADVFEDRHGRADALGNVLMIHKQQSRIDSELFPLISESLCDLAHNGFEFRKRSVSFQELIESTRLSELDDLEAEEIARAKRKIGRMRHELESQENYIERLQRKLYRARKTVDRLVELLSSKLWCPSCGQMFERQNPDSEHFTCEGKGHVILNDTRNFAGTDNKPDPKRQCDKDGNFSTVTTWLTFD